MKRRILTSVIAFSSACIAVATLQAQSFDTAGNIPFAFHVGQATLPAGHYKFSQLLPNQFQVIRNQDTGRTIMLTAGPAAVKGAPQSAVTFHQYGQAYFLNEIQSANGSAVELRVSSAEREVRDRSNQEAKVSVVLLASR